MADIELGGGRNLQSRRNPKNFSDMAAAAKELGPASALFGAATAADPTLSFMPPSAAAPSGQLNLQRSLPRKARKVPAATDTSVCSAPFIEDASGGFLSLNLGRRSIGKALSIRAGLFYKRPPVTVGSFHLDSNGGGDSNDSQITDAGSNNLTAPITAKPLQRLNIRLSNKQGNPDRKLPQEGFNIQPAALMANLLSSYQIQITLLSGRTMLHWVQATDLVQDLLNNLECRLGIPSELQRLLHKGKQLENPFPLSYYSINRDASIVLSLRLRGGAPGQSSSTPAFSYKDAVHAQPHKKSATSAEAPKPFLVDKTEEVPSIEISNPSLDEQIQMYAESAIICRFNGLWPRTTDLYQWIHANWTDNCQVFLCSKGFFIVMFAFSEDYQKALTGGPWFWGAAGLFFTPWFPDFDPSSAVVTKLPIWVRLPNLPAHLWHVSVFQGIGNALGRFLDTDTSRGDKGIYTYGRICAEIDLSKGLPDQINLKIGDFHWTQTLDYENTAFRCRYCHQTGHLQNTCSSFPGRKQKTNSKPKSKSWKPYDPPPMNDLASSSSDEEELEEEGEKYVHRPRPALRIPLPLRSHRNVCMSLLPPIQTRRLILQYKIIYNWFLPSQIIMAGSKSLKRKGKKFVWKSLPTLGSFICLALLFLLSLFSFVHSMATFGVRG